MSDYCVKISVKSDNHALHNLSSNPTDKVSEFDNKDSEKTQNLEQNRLDP